VPQSPANVDILFDSPADCRNKPPGGRSTVTYYSAPGGAGVFSTGTIGWICELAAISGPACIPKPSGPLVPAITANVLTVFGTGPAGAVHPSTGAGNTVGTGKTSAAPSASASASAQESDTGDDEGGPPSAAQPATKTTSTSEDGSSTILLVAIAGMTLVGFAALGAFGIAMVRNWRRSRASSEAY
jgi:hypothetical protein